MWAFGEVPHARGGDVSGVPVRLVGRGLGGRKPFLFCRAAGLGFCGAAYVVRGSVDFFRRTFSMHSKNHFGRSWGVGLVSSSVVGRRLSVGCKGSW